MIDTIVLSIPKEYFRILDYEVFNPTARYLFEPPFYRLSKGYISCVQTPSKKQFLEGDYKPRLTLSKRMSKGGYSLALKIEFSAPKLLFGNNFDELDDRNFLAVITKLHQKLKEMQVDVSIEHLKTAQVTGVHYGKNIFLKDVTSSIIINTIRKIDISKRLDAGNTDFRNEGQAIRFHTNSYELTFYDKMKDLEQAKISDKRAIELDNAIQLNLFSKEELVRKEVLRMEVRLNKTKKIKEMLKTCKCTDSNTTFVDLFDKDISRRVLQHFFDTHIIPSLSIVLLSEENSQEIFCKIKQNGFSNNKILQIIGALQIIKDTGIRTLKSVLESRNFYRLKKDLEEIKNDENYLYSAFKRVRLDVIEMKSLKLEGIKENDKIL